MQTVTEILIDYSTSMKGDRLAICKKMLVEEVVPVIEDAHKIGIKTFSASRNKVPAITERQRLAVMDKKDLIDVINNLDTPGGNTPIAAAIKSAVDSLKRQSACHKVIVLITDGEENCNGDYEAEASKAKEENCTIHVIGLGLEGEAIDQAKKIASVANGTFSNLTIPTYAAYKSDYVKATITKFAKAMKEEKATLATPQADVAEEDTASQPVTPETREKSEPVTPSEPTKEQEISPEKEVLSVEPDKSDVDFSGLTAAVKSNSELLHHIIGELKGMKTGLQNLKDNEVPSDQEKGEEENEEKIEIEIEEETFVKEDDELAEKLEAASKKYVFALLKGEHGERVRRVEKQEESSHDFEVVDIDGTVEYYIKCKGAKDAEKSFLVTKDEWRLFLSQSKNYKIFFVSDVLNEPTLTEIDNLLAWILTGRIVPYADKRLALDSEKVILTIVEP